MLIILFDLTFKFLKNEKMNIAIILKNKLIYFSKDKAAKNCSKTLRLVISQNKENGETITLLTK
ncbi:hypothetical protein [Treponema sp.]|uniref:hypothetical protein n=1 Tax=Treponema sp. TaxID=166 RepID=UPI003FD850D0